MEITFAKLRKCQSLPSALSSPHPALFPQNTLARWRSEWCAKKVGWNAVLGVMVSLLVLVKEQNVVKVEAVKMRRRNEGGKKFFYGWVLAR